MNIYIVGGNGFARECYGHLMQVTQKFPDRHFAGFLGHGGFGHTVDYKHLQQFYLGEVSEHVFGEDDYIVIGAGYPELRSKIYKELKARNLKFYNLGAETISEQSVKIGEANVFVPPFSPSCNVEIGNCNVLNGSVLVGHDSVIGDCNFFGPRSQVLGSVTVGSYNVIGANSVLLPHCKVGSFNKIAPLSAIYKGCRNNSYMIGNPAIKVGEYLGE